MNAHTVAVIGGGIHGLSTAIALAESGLQVTMVEKDGIFSGTSRATVNRAHRGYHYPRSPETARECREGLEILRARYPSSVMEPSHSYYLIAKKGSRVTPDAFEDFCRNMDLELTKEWPGDGLASRETLADSYLVREPCYDATAIAKAMQSEAQSLGVEIKTGCAALTIRHEGIAGHEIVCSSHGSYETLQADLVVNATYTGTNSVLLAGGLATEVTEYVFQTTEVVVVRADPRTPALTVMDGPFMSVLPCAGRPGFCLVYDVELSVARNERGIEFKGGHTPTSNWDRMKKKGTLFLPFMGRLEYVESLWGLRPVIPDDATDSRGTRIVAHRGSPGFYSILEGKFVSAPLMARRLAERIRQDGWLS